MGKSPCDMLVLFVLFFFIETRQFCRCLDSVSQGCIAGERQTLLTFKQSLKDPSNRLLSWRGKDCCKWQGVHCNNITRHIVELDLKNPVRLDPNGYAVDEISTQIEAEEIDSSLVELEHLTHLDLSWNNFKGSPIPKFIGSLKHLRYLNLSAAHLSGTVPHQLGNLSGLRVLDLSDPVRYEFDYDSGLTVDNLQWVSRLSSLRRLDMSWVYILKAHHLVQVINKLPSLLELRLAWCALEINLFHASFNHTSPLTLEYLDLSYNKLRGLIPNALQNMTALKVLDLSFNYFNSTVPLWFNNIKSLEHLNLRGNELNHIEGGMSTSLWNLCHLKTLDLAYNNLVGEMLEPSENISQCVGYELEALSVRSNRFSGRLPHWLGKLKNLKYLDLASNSIYGPIPESLGRLLALRELDLSNNQLNGSIPVCLGQLSDLRSIDISSNSFEGVISEGHFANLSWLEKLSTSFNSLIFKVASDWVPPFQLKYIHLTSCKIGPQFPRWLRTQTKLIDLDLSNTSISCALPKWFRDMHQLHLFLSNNEIWGPLKNLPLKVLTVDLSNNLISGSLPHDFGGMLPALENLILSENLLRGFIPNSICKLKALQSLDLSKNRLFGNLPHCWQDLQELVILDLSSNNLSGVIPSSIGNLSALQLLHLNNNSLYGKVPTALKNCGSLIVLDLGENGISGSIPTWIGEEISSLEILRLRSNMFYGSIPSKLCLLNELQILDIANNKISGSIPHCFFNFTGMILGKGSSQVSYYNASNYDDKMSEVIKGSELEYTKTLQLVINMDLSNNNLVGRIPEELTTLSGLIGLNLSQNHLSGNIPKNIGNLKFLESLDFSKNQLSGTIPQSISALTYLSHLNLSYNNLSGQIPLGNQLQTLDDPSIYIGNHDLCGAPLPKKCASEEAPQASATDDEGNESERIWFYLVIALGYATGFWGVFGVLIFKKSWRYTYFQFVDNTKDWILVAIALKVAWLKNKMGSN